eukprot:gene11504-2095_t
MRCAHPSPEADPDATAAQMQEFARRMDDRTDEVQYEAYTTADNAESNMTGPAPGRDTPAAPGGTTRPADPGQDTDEMPQLQESSSSSDDDLAPPGAPFVAGLLPIPAPPPALMPSSALCRVFRTPAARFRAVRQRPGRPLTGACLSRGPVVLFTPPAPSSAPPPLAVPAVPGPAPARAATTESSSPT